MVYSTNRFVSSVTLVDISSKAFMIRPLLPSELLLLDLRCSEALVLSGSVVGGRLVEFWPVWWEH